MLKVSLTYDSNKSTRTSPFKLIFNFPVQKKKGLYEKKKNKKNFIFGKIRGVT